MLNKKQKGLYVGLSTTLLTAIITAWLWAMDVLNGMNPDSFGLSIDPGAGQSDGLAWTFTLILVLFCFLTSIYMFMESRTYESTLRKINASVSITLLSIGISFLIVLVASVLKEKPFEVVLFPRLAAARGDSVLALCIAASGLFPLNLVFDKTLRDDARFKPHKVMYSTFALVPAIICMALYQGTDPGLRNDTAWRAVSYSLLGGIGFNLVLGMLSMTITYFKIAKESSGALKRSSVKIAFGFIITFTFTALHYFKGDLPPFPFNWLAFMLGQIAGIFMILDGYISMDPEEKQQMAFMIVASACFMLIIPALFLMMKALNEINPESFGMEIDLSGRVQVDGLTWIVTIILSMFYFIAGIYLYIEAKKTSVMTGRRFQYGLVLMFVFMGFAQLIVVVQSMLLNEPFNIVLVAKLASVRGDTVMALSFACFSPAYAIYQIEKQVKDSKRFILTKFVFAGMIASIVALFMADIQECVPSLERDLAWRVASYSILGLMGLSLFVSYMSIPTIYITLGKKTYGGLRRNSNLIAGAFIILILSTLLHILRGNIPDFPFNWLVFIITSIVGAMLLISEYTRSIIPVLEHYSSENICIVHRGKIEGKTIICPECMVKYCKQCFDSVIKEENKCWNCGSMIHGEKAKHVPGGEIKQIPVNDIKVESSQHKKKKNAW